MSEKQAHGKQRTSRSRENALRGIRRAIIILFIESEVAMARRPSEVLDKVAEALEDYPRTSFYILAFLS